LHYAGCSGFISGREQGVQGSDDNELQCSVWLMQVIYAVAKLLRTMHDAGYAHRDIKPGSFVCLPSSGAWSLIDFGCAAKIGALPFCVPAQLHMHSILCTFVETR
jgi:serine/threonine protein kinase